MAESEGRMSEIAAALAGIVAQLESEETGDELAAELTGEAARLTTEAAGEVERAMRRMAQADE